MPLTKDYQPRYSFNPNYPIEHELNGEYVTAISKVLLGRLKKTAKAYHEKHNGTKDNGALPKKVTVTLKEVEKLVKESNSKAPNGQEIYWPSPGVMNHPTKAMELGLMTKEQNKRRPSFDRIKSSLKEYSYDNGVISTIRYNMMKGNDDGHIVNASYVSVKVELQNGIKINLDNPSPEYLSQYTQSLASVA